MSSTSDEVEAVMQEIVDLANHRPGNDPLDVKRLTVAAELLVNRPDVYQAKRDAYCDALVRVSRAGTVAEAVELIHLAIDSLDRS